MAMVLKAITDQRSPGVRRKGGDSYGVWLLLAPSHGSRGAGGGGRRSRVVATF